MLEDSDNRNSTETDAKRWLTLDNKRRERYIADSFSAFRKIVIEPTLIKGLAISRYYPATKSRQFNDTDLVVSREEFLDAYAIVHSKKLVKYRIDLHNELRDLDTVPWETVFARTQLVKIGDTDIRIPCPEDHLRVLCVHWLMDGGEFKHRLWDIYYLIDATRDTFDWDMCLRDISPNRREWIECVVGLAHKYLDLNIDDLPFAERIRELPKWLIKAVEKEWEDGVPQRPILTTLNKPKEFIRQFKKRIRPNPLRAVIDMEGSFYRPKLTYYRIGSFSKRLSAMLKRIFTIAFRR